VTCRRFSRVNGSRPKAATSHRTPRRGFFLMGSLAIFTQSLEAGFEMDLTSKQREKRQIVIIFSHF
jgi:hypothetical protein